MKNSVSIVLFLSVWLCLSACIEQGKKRTDIRSLAKEWDGKEVRFPEKIYFTRYVTDTVPYDFKQSDYKIVLYMDSIGCLGCKLKLHRWKQLMADFDSTCQTSISYLFFLDTKRLEKIEETLEENRFDHPVCIDVNSEFQRLNHVPEDDRFHAFLLNKENRVVAVGNPVTNEEIKVFYKKVMQMGR